jgi:hypothetical protein
MPIPFMTVLSATELRPAQWRPPFSAARCNSAFDWAARLTLVFVLSFMIFGNVSWIIHAVGSAENHASDHLLLNIAAGAARPLFGARAAANTR